MRNDEKNIDVMGEPPVDLGSLDPAVADDQQGPLVQIKALVRLAHRPVGPAGEIGLALHVLGQPQHHAQRVLGDRAVVGARGDGHRQAARAHPGDIYRIRADAVARDNLQVRRRLQQRGIDMEDALSMIVNGFCKEVLAELPMEFAVEARKLLGVSLEGSVG